MNIYKYLAGKLSQYLVQQEEPVYTRSEEVADIKNLSFTTDEKEYLRTISQNKQFISIIDKLVLQVKVAKALDPSESERLMKIGAIKALEGLKVTAKDEQPTPKIDHRTGKNI